MPIKSRPVGGGNGSGAVCVVPLDDPNSDVHDPLVRLLRPGEGAPRLEAAAVRGDLAGRRSELPPAPPGSDRRLDRAADPDRRAADRRLHRALAPRARRPARRAPRRLTLLRQVHGLERLAAGAEPRPAPADARLRDRRPAAVARLPAAAVHLELVLHRPAIAVRQAVVAERRPLARDADLERLPDRRVQPAKLVPVDRLSRPERVDPRTPERLVDVDVPHAGKRPLVEEGRLDRRTPPRELRAEPRSREQGMERLLPDLLVEIGLELARLEQQPRAEAADVAIRDI